MSRIKEAFTGKKAFIPFLTCGDPSVEVTEKLVHACAGAGADLIELGIPFSDPTAEGAVIQEANTRALAGGVTTDDIFAMVRHLRRDIRIPLVFMTYANVVFSYGTKRFMQRCAEEGIDGLILPDVPFEEKEDFLPACQEEGIDLISMVAPTSRDRIAMIAKEAEGFLYVVSSKGVTGTRREITTDIGAMTRLIRENTAVPCAVGFGISTPQQAKEISRHADGVIVGSAVMKIVKTYAERAPAHVARYVKEMKEAISI